MKLFDDDDESFSLVDELVAKIFDFEKFFAFLVFPIYITVFIFLWKHSFPGHFKLMNFNFVLLGRWMIKVDGKKRAKAKIEWLFLTEFFSQHFFYRC